MGHLIFSDTSFSKINTSGTKIWSNSIKYPYSKVHSNILVRIFLKGFKVLEG